MIDGFALFEEEQLFSCESLMMFVFYSFSDHLRPVAMGLL